MNAKNNNPILAAVYGRIADEVHLNKIASII